MNTKIPTLSIATTLTAAMATGCGETKETGINGIWELPTATEDCYGDTYLYEGDDGDSTYYDYYICTTMSTFDMDVSGGAVLSSSIVVGIEGTQEITYYYSDGSTDSSYESVNETYNLTVEAISGSYTITIGDGSATLDLNCTLSDDENTLSCSDGYGLDFSLSKVGYNYY